MLPSQVCILSFATSSKVTRFPCCLRWSLIRSATCVVFGISQVCSTNRLLVTRSRISFFDSRCLTSREQGSINRPSRAAERPARASFFDIGYLRVDMIDTMEINSFPLRRNPEGEGLTRERSLPRYDHQLSCFHRA